MTAPDRERCVANRELGTVEHRGVEVSFAGEPREDLTVIVGTRWLDATVSGPTVDAGLIGEKPVGSAREYSLASLDYRLPGIRASIDATLEHLSTQTANSANTIEVPSRAVLHLGGRYRFESVGDDFTADITLDGDGLVVEYPRIARRVWSR